MTLMGGHLALRTGPYVRGLVRGEAAILYYVIRNGYGGWSSAATSSHIVGGNVGTPVSFTEVEEKS